MKKVLIILVTYHLSLVTFSAQAVKLCKKDCSVINNWKDASGTIGTTSVSSGQDGTWSLSVTISPTGTIAGGATCMGTGGRDCYCRTTSVNGNSCVGGWLFSDGGSGNMNLGVCRSSCAGWCAQCARDGSIYSCSRSALFANVVSNIPDAAAVTCPPTGTCTNTNYKTVGDGESCGSGWVETTGPTLTISGTYSDGAGTFTYGECTK